MHIPPFDNKNLPIVDVDDSRVPLNYLNIVNLKKDQSFEYKIPSIININNLSGLMYSKIAKDPKITVSLKSDEKTTMKLITDIHTQLRTANALKLSYSALTKTP